MQVTEICSLPQPFEGGALCLRSTIVRPGKMGKIVFLENKGEKNLSGGKRF
jgi:hypothetical protein